MSLANFATSMIESQAPIVSRHMGYDIDDYGISPLEMGFTDVYDSVTEAVADFFDWIAELIESTADFFMDLVDSTADFLDADFTDRVADYMDDIIDITSGFFEDNFYDVSDFFDGLGYYTGFRP